jgi:hypothetical protein
VTCRKRRFATEADAARGVLRATLLRRCGQHWRQECRYYRCADCGAWHVTSLPEWQERKPA